MTNEMQFAFKEKHSTTMCTTVVKEIAGHYNANGSNVYLCMLDATKAFDRVHYGKLFSLLKERQLPAVYLRIMLDMYTRQQICTTWNGSRSNSFSAGNGVKQGAILSPILFCVYIDGLLDRINKSGLGCHIGHMSYAGIGYADDVCIASPSITALQKLLHICETFAKEYDIQFNAKKSICIKVGVDDKPPNRNVKIFNKSQVLR